MAKARAKPPGREPDYSVIFARSARKELERLPAMAADRLLARIEALTKEPRPPGATKLQGHKNFWRIRSGDYRVVYGIEDSAKVIDVSAIRHRKDVYRDL